MTALYKASNQAFYQFTHMDHSVTQVLYAMDMDLFKQAAIADGVAAATNQNPGIHSATLIRYFRVQLLFPFFYGKYPDTYGNKYCMLS